MKETIETAVRGRQTEEARRLIQLFLKKEKRQAKARIEAVDWFRRLGLYRDAYVLVAPKVWNFQRALNDPNYARQLFWTARLLSLQGASDYALKIVSKVPPRTAEEFLIAGNIHLSALEWEASLTCYQNYFSLLTRMTKGMPNIYEMKLARVAMCDALSGLEKYDDALNEIRKIHAEPNEKNLRGVLLQAEGEYLARKGCFEEAYKVLMRAFDFFSREDQTPDMAYLHKWLGYVMAALQRDADDEIDDEVEAHFLKAILFLRKPGIRPEVWLDCWYRMYEVGYLTEEKQIQMSVYPGLLPRFSDRPGFLNHVLVGSEAALIRLYPARGEYELNGVRYFGLPRELKLLAYLRFAGEWGVGVERLKAVLWPDEVSAFLQLESRIYQLLKRLQKSYQIQTQIENGVVRISTLSMSRVWAEHSKTQLPLSFFERNPSFDSEKFASFYRLGHSVAVRNLARFVEKGMLKKKRLGKRFIYEYSGINQRTLA